MRFRCASFFSCLLLTARDEQLGEFASLFKFPCRKGVYNAARHVCNASLFANWVFYRNL